MLLAAMLAMVLAAAVPAFAQVQAAAVGQNGSGNVACVQQAANVEIGKVQISQYGDNINVQQIAQECNITVAQVNNVIASASASPAASPAAAAQYQYKAAAAQYQSPSASAAPELPSTGGSSLIALGAGVLLVAGGLLARRIVR
jgi:LPXTG-motif cell wall-anchored protein